MRKHYWLGLAIAIVLGTNASVLFRLSSRSASISSPTPSPPPNTPNTSSASVPHDWQLPDVRLPETPQPAPRDFALYGDTNRDGVVQNAEDLSGRDRWSWTRGVLLPFNHDDDNADGLPDWEGHRPSDFASDRELALLRLQVPKKWQNVPVFLQANTAARPYLRAFQRTHRGWVPIDLSGRQPLASGETLVIGMEATQFAQSPWNGYVKLVASVRQTGQVLAEDRIAARVVPWLMLSNAAPPERVFVSPEPNSRFLPQLQAQTEALGLPLTVDESQLLWMQDTMEIGFTQFPSRGGLHVHSSVLKGVRDDALDAFSRSLLKPDFGWFSVADPRPLPPDDAWIDWYGNLEVTPPLPDYPLGRIYYGTAGDRALHPEVLDFLRAQELQTPAVAIDTSWLLIRHVDEVLSFVPDGEGSVWVLVTSPQAGVELLRRLAAEGAGDAVMARGLSGERTVAELLADEATIARNLNFQSQHVNTVLSTLKQDFQIPEERIISVPALYGELGDPLFPNLVNLVVLGDRLLVSDPRGAIVNGEDAVKAEFRRLVAPTGQQVAFLDDAEYHELKGNLHCATNVQRRGDSRPFWTQLPKHLQP